MSYLSPTMNENLGKLEGDDSTPDGRGLSSTGSILNHVNLVNSVYYR